MTDRSTRFLDAAHRKPVDRPPLWMMRQAGRYLPEYRAVRQQAGDFLTLCRTPDLAVEVTLQPIRRFGFDVAILFSDILIPAVSVGADLSFAEGEGPRIHNPVRSDEDIDRLQEPEPRESSPFVYEAIRILRRELQSLGSPPLVGFAAAPYTLASYLIEGETSRGFEVSRSFLLSDPGRARRMLEKVGRYTARYLIAQAEAGAQALQLFDTWAGFLSPSDYRALALPAMRQVLDEVRLHVPAQLPLIYFVNGISPVLGDIVQTPGLNVVSVDWRLELSQAFRQAEGRVALQGNLDPAALLAGPQAAAQRTRSILEAGQVGHIMNLGHGILPKTPIESVEAVVQTVHDFRSST